MKQMRKPILSKKKWERNESRTLLLIWTICKILVSSLAERIHVQAHLFFLVAIRLQIGMEAQTRERVWMPGKER